MDPSRIRIGQSFRVSLGRTRAAGRSVTGEGSYDELTAGSYATGADVNKGIWAYQAVPEPGTPYLRRPAVILHSNPLKADTRETPWVDIIDVDAGYATYHGDNRHPERGFAESPGNKLLLGLLPLFADPVKRKLAPPFLLFRQQQVDGKRKGFREFCGFGVPIAYRVQSQREKRRLDYFSNLVVDLALFSLAEDSEVFDWGWIDRRRDSSLTSEQALRWAPTAWKRWVRDGATSLERCRRNVAKIGVVRREEQLRMDGRQRSLLGQLVAHFEKNPYAFEGLASLIAMRVVGPAGTRLWVTKRSGDGGIDFVGRVRLGSGENVAPITVLGQAKCHKPSGSVGGSDLARVVARLQRGWIGVFVTTGCFSRAAQEELRSDRYPMILVNGKRCASEVRSILMEDGIDLETLLAREAEWYVTHLRSLPPDHATEVSEKDPLWSAEGSA